jgi:hypothetical protein
MALDMIEPMVVAAYIEKLLKDGLSKPTVKQHIAHPVGCHQHAAGTVARPGARGSRFTTIARLVLQPATRKGPRPQE